MPCWQGLEYIDYPLPPKKVGGGLGYDTKLHLMVNIQFWRSGECGVHYSQIHTDIKY